MKLFERKVDPKGTPAVTANSGPVMLTLRFKHPYVDVKSLCRANQELQARDWKGRER